VLPIFKTKQARYGAAVSHARLERLIYFFGIRIDKNIARPVSQFPDCNAWVGECWQGGVFVVKRYADVAQARDNKQLIRMTSKYVLAIAGHANSSIDSSK
jgi:hypothetical protein